MTEDSTPDIPRLLRLRYPTVCATCGIALPKGSEAFWDRATRQATCLACAPVPGVPRAGAAGASAAAEGHRRRDSRVDKVRRQYGDYAAAVAEEMAGREMDTTWGKGSAGESRLAAYVRKEIGESVISLHDRLIPGTRGNIDHIFVASTGIWVVDAKSYKGKLEKREAGSLFRRTNQVYVGGKNRSNLANSVIKQVTAVIAALKPDSSLEGTEVYAALCFLDSEWGLLESPFQIGNVWVLYGRALKKRLKKDGPLSRETMERIAWRLDLSLPAAA
jgi:hypothetical protein